MKSHGMQFATDTGNSLKLSACAVRKEMCLLLALSKAEVLQPFSFFWFPRVELILMPRIQGW